jgi:hypothetical protein
MNDPRDEVPGYQLIWLTAPQAPVAVLADAEAWQARGSYPDLCFAGPVFGVAREREQGGWAAPVLFRVHAAGGPRRHGSGLPQAGGRSGAVR